LLVSKTTKAAPDIDPRVRRTRRMLFQALGGLLEEKGFDTISMQDIADKSTLHRGTIYLHFKDKFALLEAKIAEDFNELFEAKMAGASGNCMGGLRQLILTVCDFFSGLTTCSGGRGRPFEPVVEATVRSIVRSFLLEGLRCGGKVKSCSDAELRATAASWAICGTALEWCRERRSSADELADAVLPLVTGGLLMDG
jgi:AcrR family transcriptional regulator